MNDLQKQMNDAEQYASDNINELAHELVEWHKEGVLKGTLLRHLASLLPDTDRALALAENIVTTRCVQLISTMPRAMEPAKYYLVYCVYQDNSCVHIGDEIINYVNLNNPLKRTTDRKEASRMSHAEASMLCTELNKTFTGELYKIQPEIPELFPWERYSHTDAVS